MTTNETGSTGNDAAIVMPVLGSVNVSGLSGEESHNDTSVFRVSGSEVRHDINEYASAGIAEKSVDINKLRSMIAEKCRREVPALIARYEQLLTSDTIDADEFHQVEKDCGLFIKSVLGNRSCPEEIYSSMFPSLDGDVVNATAFSAFRDNGGRELLDVSRKVLRRLSRL